MTIKVGVSQKYSDIFCVTSETNALAIVTSTRIDTVLELGKRRARFVHRIHGVPTLGLPQTSSILIMSHPRVEP
jgi:hypothetical protein